MAGEWTAPFGEQLRRLREAAGITQQELAERAGLSRDAIGALETGRRRHPHPQTVRALATGLGLSEREAAALRARAPKRVGAAAAPANAAESEPAPLPVAATRLVGRRRELAELRRLLTGGDRHAQGAPGTRLVTVTGPGGVGKTRLALEMAWELAEAFPGGTAFVALAALVDPDLVLPAVAEALGVRVPGGEPLVEGLKRRLRDRRLLVVLDNVEHLAAAARPVAALLTACPGLVVLATGRAPLRLSGEQEYPLPPLAVPSPDQAATVADAAASDAVALFVQRAGAASPDFALTEGNAAAVAAICQRLDGLPLALELAAARVKVLPPTALLARLEKRLSLLTGGPLDALPRQRTMRDAIAWSYDLLNPEEQALFRRLAVFAGDFTLSAAEDVCQADLGLEVFDGIASLVDKSLLHPGARGAGGADDRGVVRFAMLATIREFGLERLAASGEAPAVRAAHAAYFLRLAEEAEPALDGSEQTAWLDRLEAEHDNLRAALTWTAGAGEAEMVLRLAGALWLFWGVRGHVREGRRWLALALATRGEAPLAVRAKALNAAGNLARAAADYEQAITLYEEGLEIWRNVDDQLGIAWSLNNLGVIARERGDAARAIALCRESLARFRAAGYELGAVASLLNLGTAARQEGDVAHARACFEEGLALARALGDEGRVAALLNLLARVLLGLGEMAVADAQAAESLTLHRKVGDIWGTALSLNTLGRVAIARGDLVGAAARFAESLRLLAEIGARRSIVEGLEDLAGVVTAGGHPELAARLFGAAEALREAIGAERPPVERADHARRLADLRTALAEEELATAWAAGRALPMDAAVAEAMATAAAVDTIPPALSPRARR